MKDWDKQTIEEKLDRVLKTLEKGDELDYNETSLLKSMIKAKRETEPICIFCGREAETVNIDWDKTCYKHRTWVQ